MIDCLSIVETDKVNHTVEIDMVKLVVEIKSFDMSFDEFDKETGSSDGLQPKQADLNCVHALKELYLHKTRVIPNSLCGDLFKSLHSGLIISPRSGLIKPLHSDLSGLPGSGLLNPPLSGLIIKPDSGLMSSR
ncbi:hypothetical protein Tco_1305953 [Tanacetum coccineum]